MNSGIDSIPDGKSDFEKLYCRGYVVDDTFYENVNEITIETETAWEPMLEMWQVLLDKYLPDAEFIYTAAQQGDGIYETNDPDYQGKYVVDVCDESGCQYFDDYDDVSKDELIKFLNEKLDTNLDDVDELIKIFYDQERSDLEGSINEWKMVDPA